MGKYEPLARYLSAQPLREVPMTFADVERVIGAALPASAYKHRPWWGNEATGHVHARAWLAAGYHTERVDMAGRTVVFVRPADSNLGGSARTGPRVAYERHPLLGALKGLIKVAPGVDLTEPADPEWGRRAYGDDP